MYVCMCVQIKHDWTKEDMAASKNKIQEHSAEW